MNYLYKKLYRNDASMYVHEKNSVRGTSHMWVKSDEITHALETIATVKHRQIFLKQHLTTMRDYNNC